MTILNIPGWKNSKEGHWQTIWETDDPQRFRRIRQKDWMFPERGAWVKEIRKAVSCYSAEHVLVTAHSIGCVAFVHAVSAFQLQVHGVLLVAPSDPEQPDYPTAISGFAPVPLKRLPFPSIVVASSNDPAVSLLRAQHFAEKWGSRFISIQNAGHIDQKSGYGIWPEGRKLLKTLES